MVVLWPPHHSAVGVVEPLQVGDAEDLATALELQPSLFHDGGLVVVVVFGLYALGSVPAATIGARDQHGPDAFGGVSGQDSPGAYRFVIRMGVHRHECQGSHRREA
jgi:hypothetical protein